jgi:GAF domain-containing protein
MAARLSALRRTKLLDSPSEVAFDRFTRLASRLLGTPVSFVTLVDEGRQFFKSSVGLTEPLASRRQTPLSHSFCQYVVASRRPLVVSDARKHPLVRDNPAISEFGVASYLGIPLTSPDGHVLGSFCAIDHTARAWTPDDEAVMNDLAASVLTEISLRVGDGEESQADQALRASHGWLELVRTVRKIGAWHLDAGSGVLTSSPGLLSLYGARAGDGFSYEDLLNRIHPDDRDGARLAIEDAVAKESRYEVEYRVVRPDGSTQRVLATGHGVKATNQRPLFVAGIAVAIRESERAGR